MSNSVQKPKSSWKFKRNEPISSTQQNQNPKLAVDIVNKNVINDYLPYQYNTQSNSKNNLSLNFHPDNNN